MRINCPTCGHKVELDEAYDDYEGPIRCWVCRAAFEIRAEDGCVKAVRSGELAPSPSPRCGTGVSPVRLHRRDAGATPAGGKATEEVVTPHGQAER